MPKNIEVKMRLDCFDEVVARASALSATACEVFEQVDTYFDCQDGRLKLREERGRPAHLIAYRRADLTSLRPSHYILTEILEPESFTAAMALTIGIRGRVRKRRRLFREGPARVHLDAVDGLGHFLELEVVLEGRPQAEGEEIARSLLERLEPRGEIVAGSYIDLLMEKPVLQGAVGWHWSACPPVPVT